MFIKHISPPWIPSDHTTPNTHTHTRALCSHQIDENTDKRHVNGGWLAGWTDGREARWKDKIRSQNIQNFVLASLLQPPGRRHKVPAAGPRAPALTWRGPPSCLPAGAPRGSSEWPWAWFGHSVGQRESPARLAPCAPPRVLRQKSPPKCTSREHDFHMAGFKTK